MYIEMGVSDARAKRRVLAVLRDLGHEAGSGPVLASEPFTVVISGVARHDVGTVVGLVTSVDPGALRLGRNALVDDPAA